MTMPGGPDPTIPTPSYAPPAGADPTMPVATSTPGTTAVVPAPAITQFQVTRNGACPAATQATALWTTQNAVNVTIWIDNPAGTGTTYGPSNPPGGQSLTFVCASAP